MKIITFIYRKKRKDQLYRNVKFKEKKKKKKKLLDKINYPPKLPNTKVKAGEI